MTAIHPGANAAECHQSCHQFVVLKCRLGRPWHYRRNGRYYLRLRPRGSYRQSVTISLRTSERPAAMSLSQEILQALATFHLDNPEAAWEELRERLLDIAEDCLSQAHDDSSLSAYEMIYHDLGLSLAEASAKAPLSLDQQRALILGRQIMKAAQRRLKGDPEELMEIINELYDDQQSDRNRESSVSPSVNAPSDPITFEGLSGLFIKERQGNVEDSTLKAIQSNCRTLSGLLGDLNIKTHTRADMVALKKKLMDGRRVLTVNKLLTQLSTVMDWAKNNGHIERSFDKDLKIERGAESERRPFSQDQVATIMAHANALPASDWKRWALSLGALTGARIGELYQLTQNDVKQVDGITVIDINKDEQGKTLKNDFSVRQVPLVDGPMGSPLRSSLSGSHRNPASCSRRKLTTSISRSMRRYGNRWVSRQVVTSRSTR